MIRPGNVALPATLALVAALAASLFLGFGRRGGARAPEQVAITPRIDVESERPRVEVRNASGTPGRARHATRLLRDRGYDVVAFGNASGFAPDSSLVIDRVGKPEIARRVARSVGVRQVRSLPDTSLYLDVSVILGRDWFPPDSAGR